MNWKYIVWDAVERRLAMEAEVEGSPAVLKILQVCIDMEVKSSRG